MERQMKHLVTAVCGIGLCIGGNMISDWYLMLDTDAAPIYIPFAIIGRVLIVAGIICLIGALLCQTGRYDKS